MSANSPKTYVELYTDVIQRVRENISNTTVVDIAKRLINLANQDIHIQQNWWWAERRSQVATKGAYVIGTVATSTSARTTVTGNGTLWNTAVPGYGWKNANAGDKIQFGGSGDVYLIASVGSDTTLTLTDKWVGATALSAQSYTIFSDEYSLASDFWRLRDARQFTTAFMLPCISRREFFQRFPRNNVTSLPQVCTIIDLAPSGNTTRVPKVVLHPPPDQPYNIPYWYQTINLALTSTGVGATDLVGDTDEPIIPQRYRQLLVAYAVREWYRDRKDDARSNEAAAWYQDLLRRAANDSEPERDHPKIIMRTWQYKAGVAGRLRTGHSRFTTGRRWDELRD